MFAQSLKHDFALVARASDSSRLRQTPSQRRRSGKRQSGVTTTAAAVVAAATGVKPAASDAAQDVGGGSTTRVKEGNRSKSKVMSAMQEWAFRSKINVRRTRNGKNAHFADALDLEKDFSVESSYGGPHFTFVDKRTSKLRLTPSAFMELAKCFLAEADNARVEEDEKSDQADKPKTPKKATAKATRKSRPLILHPKYVFALLMSLERRLKSTSSAVQPVCYDADEGGCVHVVGDLHGQLFELAKIFREKGLPEAKMNVFVFNGDVVDRGPNSLECVLLIVMAMLVWPGAVVLNRGNHESFAMNVRGGFHGELKRKLSRSSHAAVLADYFGHVFAWLPLATVINDRVVVVHGGISDRIATLEDIRKIKRPAEPAAEASNNTGSQIVADILWSDPKPEPGVGKSSRGVGVFFGPDVTEKFLETNDLMYMVRSHSEITSGCGCSHRGCYTVYSAANEAKGVLGGILTIHGKYLNKEGQSFRACSEAEIEVFKAFGLEIPEDLAAKTDNMEEQTKKEEDSTNNEKSKDDKMESKYTTSNVNDLDKIEKAP